MDILHALVGFGFGPFIIPGFTVFGYLFEWDTTVVDFSIEDTADVAGFLEDGSDAVMTFTLVMFVFDDGAFLEELCCVHCGDRIQVIV